MTDELSRIERDAEEGRATAESLVQLFNLASEAEQRRDVALLTRACAVARRLAEAPGDGLSADARRLVDLCDELLARVAASEAAGPGLAPKPRCPGCGRELAGNPVRCRACGELLV
ncbi:MAG TPA: hypothetical protein VE995_05320 [Gaiellaceae bacterium]|nr:hypothetical protein [Gaiellaceae bacterium]